MFNIFKIFKKKKKQDVDPSKFKSDVAKRLYNKAKKKGVVGKKEVFQK